MFSFSGLVLNSWKTLWSSERKRRVRQPSRSLRFESLEEKTVLATFAVIGDFGNSGPGELAVANMVKSWNPAAILTVGDNNYPNGSAATIDANIGQYYHSYIGNYRGSYGAGSATNRFFPTLGNHDWETSGAQPYLDYFTLPGNERYYDFVLDNVHFFAVDSDVHEPHGISSSSTQAQWLRNGLLNSQQPFNVVYFHHSPYSSEASTTALRWPFKEWGADAVLSGHNHQYERLSVSGLPYFVNGLGGAEIRSFGTPIPESQVRYNSNYGAMRVVTGSSTLRLEFLSIAGNGTLIDSLTLTANGVVNDQFSNAISLSGTSVSANGTNVGATFETGEPNNIATVGGKSVWWKWTAPSAGTVTVNTAGSGFDTTLGVYTGTAVNGLTRVASNDDESSSILSSRLTFTAVAGQTYRISVDGYAGASGSISLQLSAPQSPPATSNNAFASRIVLVGGNVATSGSNVGATVETGEKSNAGVPGGKSVWWSWTAPASGPVTVSTAGSSFDTTLGIYNGSSVASLTSLTANDDVTATVLTSQVTFLAVAGRAYQISVDGYKGASGQIRLAIIGNNNFANRAVLTGSTISLTGSNVVASLESGEPKNAGATGGKSVWWSWTAPANGSVTISTTGSSFDTTLGVYTGTSISALTSVASNDDEGGSALSSRVQFTTVAGRTYQISVDGYHGTGGEIRLSLNTGGSTAMTSSVSLLSVSSPTLTTNRTRSNTSPPSDQRKNRPPLISINAPVIKAPASLTNMRTAAATSSGVPFLPKGVSDRYWSILSGLLNRS